MVQKTFSVFPFCSLRCANSSALPEPSVLLQKPPQHNRAALLQPAAPEAAPTASTLTFATHRTVPGCTLTSSATMTPAAQAAEGGMPHFRRWHGHGISWFYQTVRTFQRRTL